MSRWQPSDDRSGNPHPGFYTMKLVKGGPLVPCRILHGDEGWFAVIDGKAYPPHPDPAYEPYVMRVWHSAQHSDEATYSYLTALKAWAAENAPDHPSMHPRHPVNIALLPPVIP